MQGPARLSRTVVATMAVTIGLAGVASAAYQVAERHPARAAAATAGPAVPVALTAAVTPARVPYGGTVHVDGVVRDEYGAPLAGTAVEVVAARLDAPAQPLVVASPTTDAEGHLAVAFRPAAGSAVWVRFGGDPAHQPGSSETARIRVVQRVEIAAKTRKTKTGWTTTLSGVVTPGRAGQPVRLERATAHGWVAASAGRLSSASTYAFVVRHAHAGTVRYRVVRPADDVFEQGSATYVLRLAAATPAEAAPTPPGALIAGNGGGPGRLLVTGDSLAYYLGQQLAAARGAKPTGVESRVSSGLARPDYFDWDAEARRQAATNPGAVVVFIGANDCQPLRTNRTGAWTSVGSAGWVAEYRRRAASMMRSYAGTGTGTSHRPVYWVGLPIAKEADIAACYRGLNAATKAAATDVRGVTWVDTWAMYAVNGRYADRVHGVLARTEDGIHLTFAGTRFLTRAMLALL
jgi:lysophospholipase L1-like esterase